MSASDLLNAKISAYEASNNSARAKVDVVIAQMEETFQANMTREEWARCLRGLWLDFSDDSALEALYEAYNEYLGLRYELYQVKDYMVDQMSDDWFMEV